jgi:DNA-binding response OmpR family regulator
MIGHRILIADDDIDALRLVGLALERQGYEIVAAATGQQAVQKAIELQPAAIILDVSMPDMDGLAVATQLREHPATESIPILMFTAHAAVNDRIAGFQAGATEYLTKPIRPRDLLARVDALVQEQPRVREELESGRIVGFLPTKGGLGTSTLTLNAAVELARMQRDQSCAVIELQEGGATLGLQMGIEGALGGTRGLAALRMRPLSSLTRDSVAAQLVRYGSRLHVLLSPAGPAGLEPDLSPGYARTILRYLGATYDHLLLDLPDRLDPARREALKLCDPIFVTLEPSRVGVELAKSMINALDASGVDIKRVHLVVARRVPEVDALTRREIVQAFERQVLAEIPAAPELAYQSMEAGRAMVDVEPQGTVAQEVRRIVQAIATTKGR